MRGSFDSFEKSGEYELAAKHAFFSGQLEKSMNYLRLCKGELVPFSLPRLCTLTFLAILQ